MEAKIETEPTLRRQAPVQLFDLEGFSAGGSPLRTYDVAADGQRFLMMKPAGGTDEGVDQSH